jgi:AcrR family transcriptional regulator
VTDAREQMIDAAERLAAERGLAAMSLREVQAAAGQRNKSAAQYHFGSKEGLVEAVVAARMGVVGARRREMLDALGATPDRRDLVEALVLPLADHVLAGPDASRWARFLLQASNDPTFATVVRRSFEGSSFRDVRVALLASLDHLPEPIRPRRLEHALGLVVASLAVLEAGTQPDGRTALPPAVQVTDLVDMAVGVLDAPASAATTAALTDRPARRA